MMITKSAEIKVYLEGIQVDVSSITITENGKQPAGCSVNMASGPNGLDVLPGTIIQVFYKEYARSDYVIIYEGELLTKQFQKNATGSHIVLNFLGLTNQFNRVFKKSSTLLDQNTTNTANLFVVTEERNPDSENSMFTLPSSELQASTGGYLNLTTIFSNSYKTLLEKIGEEKILQTSIETLFSEISKTNSWFKYFYNSFKIHDRIQTFRNDKSEMAFSAMSTETFNSRMDTGVGNMASLIQILYMFLSNFAYKMIHCAKPEITKDGVKSLMFIPNSGYMTPALPNVFFGEDVVSAGFTHNSPADPTRISVASNPMKFMFTGNNNALAGLITLSPTCYVSQNTEIISTKSGKMINLTDEEQYRGIVPSMSQLDGLDRAYANSLQSTDDDIKSQKDINKIEPTEFDSSMLKGHAVTNYIRAIAERTFWDKKYMARSFSLTTTYSPYRMVGLPGVFVDKTLPSVMGMIESISTTFSAEGVIRSSVTFGKPIIINDVTPESDLIPELSDWFDESYDVDNVGINLYNKLFNIDSKEDKSSICKTVKADESATKDRWYTTKRIAQAVTALKEERFVEQSQKIIERELLTENGYWEFMLGAFERRNEGRPHHPSNIKSKDIYRDYENIDEDRISADPNKEAPTTYKPFVLKRKEAVERAFK